MKVGDRFGGLPHEQGRRILRITEIKGDLFTLVIEESDRWPHTVGQSRWLYRSTLQNKYTPIPGERDAR